LCFRRPLHREPRRRCAGRPVQHDACRRTAAKTVAFAGQRLRIVRLSGRPVGGRVSPCRVWQIRTVPGAYTRAEPAKPSPWAAKPNGPRIETVPDPPAVDPAVRPDRGSDFPTKPDRRNRRRDGCRGRLRDPSPSAPAPFEEARNQRLLRPRWRRKRARRSELRSMPASSEVQARPPRSTKVEPERRAPSSGSEVDITVPPWPAPGRGCCSVTWAALDVTGRW